MRNNFLFCRPDDPALPGGRTIPFRFCRQKLHPYSPHRFCFQENRTYDEVFGQLPGGAKRKWRGLAKRFRFKAATASAGLNTSTSCPTIWRWRAVSPFRIICTSMRTYPPTGTDGWPAPTPTEWVETSVAASSRRESGMRWNSKALATWPLFSTGGSLFPEDYNEAGSMWDHLNHYGKPFWNFGSESCSPPERRYTLTQGYAYAINLSGNGSLVRQSSGMPRTIWPFQDQYRVDRFVGSLTSAG